MPHAAARTAAEQLGRVSSSMYLGSPAQFERARAKAIAAGPADEDVEAAFKRLKADEAAVSRAFEVLDRVSYPKLNRLRVAAYRGGVDEAVAYYEEVRCFVDAALMTAAEDAAREGLIRYWDMLATSLEVYS